jgi:hypothetical protein
MVTRMRLAGALVLLLVDVGVPAAGPPPPAALAAWDRYVAATEQRIARELVRESPFLVEDVLAPGAAAARVRAEAPGTVFTRRLAPATAQGEPIAVPDALLHHWLGGLFVPGVQVADVLAFVQDYDHHARAFEDVVASRLRSRQGDRFEVYLKLRRTKVITVYYDTEHRVDYRVHDVRRASSRSVATSIRELENGDRPDARPKAPADDSGYMWRLNSYWRFEQAPGGVHVECESVSLSRTIPWAVRFVVAPFVNSIPRESLERTLSGIRAGVLARAATGKNR